MALREIYYSELLTATTNNSPASLTGHNLLEYTATAGTKYLCIWSSLCNMDGTGNRFFARLQDGNNPGAFVEQSITPHDTANYQSVFGMIYNHYDLGGGAYSWASLHRPGGGGLITTMQEDRLLVIEVLSSGGDVIYQDSTPKTTSSTSFDGMGSVTLDPPQSEDYIILAMGFVGIDTASRPVTIRMYDGTNGYREMKFRPVVAADRRGYAAAFKLANITSSTTVSIQIKVDNAADTAEIKSVVIVAMRLSTFENTYYVEELAKQVATQDGVWVTELTNTQTPNAAGHIIFASAIVDQADNSAKNEHRFTDGGTTKITGIVEPNVVSGKDDASFFYCGRETYAASSRTWTLDQRRVGGGLFSFAGMADMAIAVIEDGVTTVVPTVHILGETLTLGDAQVA